MFLSTEQLKLNYISAITGEKTPPNEPSYYTTINTTSKKEPAITEIRLSHHLVSQINNLPITRHQSFAKQHLSTEPSYVQVK